MADLQTLESIVSPASRCASIGPAPTLRQAAKPFLELVQAWNGPRVEKDVTARAVDRWIARWGSRRVDDLGASELRTHLTELSLKDFDDVEVRRERDALRQFCSWAWSQGWMPTFPARKLPTTTRRQRAAAIAWTSTEQAALLEACRPRGFAWRRSPPYLLPLVRLGLCCGLSAGLVLHLERRHFDLDLGEIEVPPIESPTGRQLRGPLDDACVSMLRGLPAFIDEAPTPAARVFDAYPIPRRGYLLDLDAIERELVRACGRARIAIGGLDSLQMSFRADRACRRLSAGRG